MTFFVQNISFFPSHVKLAHPVGNSMKFIIFKSIYHIFGPLLTKLLSKESLVPDVLFTSFEYVIIKCFWRCCVCKHFLNPVLQSGYKTIFFVICDTCNFWEMVTLQSGVSQDCHVHDALKAHIPFFLCIISVTRLLLRSSR